MNRHTSLVALVVMSPLLALAALLGGGAPAARTAPAGLAPDVPKPPAPPPRFVWEWDALPPDRGLPVVGGRDETAWLDRHPLRPSERRPRPAAGVLHEALVWEDADGQKRTASLDSSTFLGRRGGRE